MGSGARIRGRRDHGGRGRPRAAKIPSARSPEKTSKVTRNGAWCFQPSGQAGAAGARVRPRGSGRCAGPATERSHREKHRGENPCADHGRDQSAQYALRHGTGPSRSFFISCCERRVRGSVTRSRTSSGRGSPIPRVYNGAIGSVNAKGAGAGAGRNSQPLVASRAVLDAPSAKLRAGAHTAQRSRT